MMPAFYRLYVEGARYYGELVAGTGGTRRDRSWVSAASARSSCRTMPMNSRRFDRVLSRRRADTPEMGATSLLSPRETRTLFPPLRADLAGLHVANGARVDGRRMAAGLLRAAQMSWCAVIEAQAEADRIRRSGHRRQACAMRRSRRTVWLSPPAPGHRALLQPLGVVSADRAAAGPDRAPASAGAGHARWPVVLPPGSHYLLAFDDSRVVAGATRENGAGFDYRVTASGQAEVLAEALHVAPGLATATIIETRVGFRPVGPDVRPLLGTGARAGRAVDRQRPGCGRPDHRPVRRPPAGRSRHLGREPLLDTRAI